MCMYVLSECINVHHVYAWYPHSQKKVSDAPGTVVKNGCELLCGYCESNLGPLEE